MFISSSNSISVRQDSNFSVILSIIVTTLFIVNETIDAYAVMPPTPAITLGNLGVPSLL